MLATFLLFIGSRYFHSLVCKQWQVSAAVSQHIWDFIVNIGLIGNIARIVYHDPSVLDMADPSHIVQDRHLRIVDLDNHLLLEMAWYSSDICIMMIFKEASAGFSLSMLYHHLASIALMILAYNLNLTYYGFTLLALLIISNPFLHVAKALHITGNTVAANYAFVMFACTFFTSRIVVFPCWFMRITLWDSYRFYCDHHLHIYMTANALLLALMGFQLLWFRKIIRIVWKAVKYNT